MDGFDVSYVFQFVKEINNDFCQYSQDWNDISLTCAHRSDSKHARTGCKILWINSYIPKTPFLILENIHETLEPISYL